MDCCCAGTENGQNGGEELGFPVSQVIPCRDTAYPHPRASSCDLLAQLPCSVPLNSGYLIDIYHLHIPSPSSSSLSLFLSVVLCWTGFTYRHCYQMNLNGYSSPMPWIQPHWMWVAFTGETVPQVATNSLHFFSFSLQETAGTRVLIPFPFGLVELFVAKHVYTYTSSNLILLKGLNYKNS